MRLLAPFRHPELAMPEPERRDTDYTDAVVAAILSRAGGDSVSTDTLAVVEIAAGLWARAFASAKVTPENPMTAALTPAVLAAMGRALLLNGEYLGELYVDIDRLAVRESCSWDVAGDVFGWTYRADFPGPSGMVSRTLDAVRVIHPRIGSDRTRPWAGVGPMARALSTLTLAARLEQSLTYEVSGPTGDLIPTPHEKGGALDKLRTDVTNLKGRTALVESMASGWGSGLDRADAPRADWHPVRLGAKPAETLPPLRSQVTETLLAAAGVPVSIVSRADGTLAREEYRRFLHSTIQPVGEVIAGELAEKLDTPGLTFDFAALGAADIQGRVRAFQGLVLAGVDVSKAAQLTGLVTLEAD